MTFQKMAWCGILGSLGVNYSMAIEGETKQCYVFLHLDNTYHSRIKSINTKRLKLQKLEV